MECKLYNLRLNSGLLHFLSVTLKISTRVIYCREQAVREVFISVFFFFNFILEVVRRGVRSGSQWTGPQVVHGPGP